MEDENLLPTEEMVINFTQDQVKNWAASVMTKKKSLAKNWSTKEERLQPPWEFVLQAIV